MSLLLKQYVLASGTELKKWKLSISDFFSWNFHQGFPKMCSVEQSIHTAIKNVKFNYFT